MLGTLAFLLLLAEGSAMDWSSLHAQQHLGVSPSAGALALGCFVAAMTVGRFSVDRIAARVGPVRTVRWGSATAVLGIAIVTVSPVLPLTLIGWAVMGLGLSGLIGWLADLTSLSRAFLFPLCGVLICACAAHSVAPRPSGTVSQTKSPQQLRQQDPNGCCRVSWPVDKCREAGVTPDSW
jgi:hypothetical protein